MRIQPETPLQEDFDDDEDEEQLCFQISAVDFTQDFSGVLEAGFNHGNS